MSVLACGCRKGAIRPGCPRHDPMERVAGGGFDWLLIVMWAGFLAYCVFVWAFFVWVAYGAITGDWLP